MRRYANVFQALHYPDKPGHRADNADCGRVAARCLPNSGLGFGIGAAISTSIMLRRSSRSAPSTAGDIALRRNGPERDAAERSRLTIPSLGASTEKGISFAMISADPSVSSKKMARSKRRARNRDGTGVVTKPSRMYPHNDQCRGDLRNIGDMALFEKQPAGDSRQRDQHPGYRRQVKALPACGFSRLSSWTGQALP